MSKSDPEGPGRFHNSAQSGDMLMDLVRAQARLMDAILSQNIETLDFLKSRYEKDRQLLADLSLASDPNAMLTMLSTFWAGAVTDYTNAAGTQSTFAAATAGQFIESLKDKAKALSGGSAGTRP